MKRPLVPRLPLKSLALAAVLLAAAAPAAASLLEYDREAILRGELWRIVTAHFVHCSTYHLTWNLLPLVAIGFLFEETLGRRFWPVLLGSCALVGGGLLLLAPGLGSYRGLSGALNGIWVAGALLSARKESREGSPALALVYRGCVLLDLGKIAFEAASGRPIFTDPADLAAEPVVLAHVLGAAAGLGAALLTRSSPPDAALSGAAPQASSMYSFLPACHHPSPHSRASSSARSARRRGDAGGESPLLGPLRAWVQWGQVTTRTEQSS